VKIRVLVEHAQDHPDTLDDVVLGRELAEVIGDLYVEPTDAPSTKWTEVAKILRVHGLKITEIDNG
jgi:hypothetical protein